MSRLDDTRLLFIDGIWQDATDGARLSIHDPATGELVGTTAVAGLADMDRAVAAANQAAAGWRSVHADARAAIIRHAAWLIEQRIEQIAALLTREQGKPLADSLKEIRFAVEVFRYYAEQGRLIQGTIRSTASQNVQSLVVSEPVGVVAAIVPWNYPVDLYAWKIAPALAAGCTIVVKPPHETPLAVAEIVRCLAEAGLPSGVLNDIPGTGPVIGAGLAAHPGIRMISATASVPAGKAIMRAAADSLKRVALELGGQCPLLVLDDADIELAAAAAMRRSFSNMGQICIAVNRILVVRSVHRKFVEAMVEATRSIRLGHGLDPTVAYGPAMNDQVRQRTAAHVADAVQRGGRLLHGGRIPKGPSYDRGFFYEPAVLDEVPRNALVMTEESFGPIAAISAVDDTRAAVAAANALPFGLASYVYGQDLERAWSVAGRIEAGGVGVNVNDVSELQAPFGGWKLSGFGRELGPEGLQAYRETKHIRMRVRRLEID